ncbi:MAG: hypothetical protein ABEL76_17295 [Bradymonadaceae bacterium]
METVQKLAREPYERDERRRPGAPPGYLYDSPDAPQPEMSILAFDESGWAEDTIAELGDIEWFHDEWEVVWLNIDGLEDAELLREVGEEFALPPLILEDIQTVPQRPRADVLDERLVMTTLMPRPDDEPLRIERGPGAWWFDRTPHTPS